VELRQLKYLVTAIQCGSIGKAAAELGMATSALSQQISRLESELSARLLVRGTAGVSPTEAGAAFYRHAMLALRYIDAASAAAQGARLSGVVSLGLAPTTASMLAMPLIEAMNRRYPNIRLQLVEGMSGHLASMLKARQIDLAVLFNTESVTFARGEAIPLLGESLFLFGPQASANDTGQRQGAISLAETASLPLILPSRAHGLRGSLDHAFAAADVSPDIVMEIDSLAIIMRAVSNGLGYTIQPGSALSSAASGFLQIWPIADEGVRRTNLLVSLPEDDLTPAALALRAQLRRIVATLVRDGRWIGATLHDS
jgi:LysR family tcuABC transcriptional regulator